MLIGRENEVRKLKDALASASSEFIAVYGRRRVGKTYLIREAYDGRFAFYHTGIADAGRTEQIARFSKSMKKHGLSFGKSPKTWYDAFDALEAALERLPPGKKVVFIDELPWMDSQRSDFVSAIESFWNGWASARTDIVLVVCGSATSWMTDKLVNARGKSYLSDRRNGTAHSGRKANPSVDRDVWCSRFLKMESLALILLYCGFSSATLKSYFNRPFTGYTSLKTYLPKVMAKKC